MDTERQLRYIPLDELIDVNDFFKRHSGVDMEHIDPRYTDAVYKGQEIIEANCRCALIYQRVAIDSRDDEGFHISTGQQFTGKMALRVLERADEMYFFFCVLEGYTNLTFDDIMVEYFADTWATAYVECAQSLFAKMVSETLEAEGMKRTHLWCPGHRQFGLENQRPLFDLLRPEEIGCSLTSRFMMVPVKAVSGFTGVVPLDAEVSMKPCDYCGYIKTCPASKKGCASL